MRGSIPVTQAALAGASGCSAQTTKYVLQEVPRTRNVCEKIVAGLKKLGHPTASNADIKEVKAADASEARGTE